MKLKALALSIALAAGVFAANAQTAYKGNDVFIGLGGGVISVYNGGFNSPAIWISMQATPSTMVLPTRSTLRRTSSSVS